MATELGGILEYLEYLEDLGGLVALKASEGAMVDPEVDTAVLR